MADAEHPPRVAGSVVSVRCEDRGDVALSALGIALCAIACGLIGAAIALMPGGC